MAKKSRTAPQRSAEGPRPEDSLSPDDATARLGGDSQTVFNASVVSDRENETAILQVVAPTGSDNESTAMLDLATLAAHGTPLAAPDSNSAYHPQEKATVQVEQAAHAASLAASAPNAQSTSKVGGPDDRTLKVQVKSQAAPAQADDLGYPQTRKGAPAGSAKSRAGDRYAQAFSRSDEPLTGPLGCDIKMIWAGDFHLARFYPLPKAVQIGKDGDFAVPPDVIGNKDGVVLVEPHAAAQFALRIDAPELSGSVDIDGQRWTLAQLRAGAGPVKGPSIPLTAKTFAQLTVGDFEFEICRATLPPPLENGKMRKESLYLPLCMLIAALMLGGPLVAGFYSPDFRDKTKLSFAEEMKERESELIEIENKVEPEKKEEPQEKPEEKKPEVPIQPAQKNDAPRPDDVKKEVKPEDVLKNVKDEDREKAKQDLVRNEMAKHTAEVDKALEELNKAPASRLFQIDDSGSGQAVAKGSDVIADPTGELSKDLGGGKGPNKGPGLGEGSTDKQVATGLEKDKGIGSKQVNIEAHEKKQTVVTIKQTGGDAEGELPKAVIKSYIATKMGAIKSCYQKGLQSNPDLAGKIKVAFLIQPTGAILGARVDDSSLSAPAVEECILNNVKAWHFPPAKGGGSTKVVYPFVFSSTH